MAIENEASSFERNIIYYNDYDAFRPLNAPAVSELDRPPAAAAERGVTLDARPVIKKYILFLMLNINSFTFIVIKRLVVFERIINLESDLKFA